jgi:hypothetical protein
MGQKKDPNRGFLMKTYGGVDPKKKYPLAEKHAKAWPALEQEVATQAITENPQAIANTRSIRPMNWWERLTTPSDTEAITTPWGGIALNRKSIEQAGTNLGNVLTHELKHIDQLQNKGILQKLFGGLTRVATGAYGDNPDEIAAFEAENKPRKLVRRDIRLPVPR